MAADSYQVADLCVCISACMCLLLTIVILNLLNAPLIQ